MNYINLMPKDWLDRSYDRWGSNVSTWSYQGSHPNVWDEDYGTYFGLYAKHNGDGSVRARLWSVHEWDDNRTLYRVKGKYVHRTFGGNYKAGWHRYIVYLKINGSWTEIINRYYDTGAGGSNSTASYTRSFDETGTWENVTGIQLWADGYSYSYEGNRWQEVWHRFYQLEGYREKYEEAFRIHDGNSVIKVGCQELDGHKLRIRKSGETVGVPLLATDNPEAISGLRVYNGSSVKSLPEGD